MLKWIELSVVFDKIFCFRLIFRVIALNYMSNRCNKVKKAGFSCDPGILYCFIAIAMFLAGLTVGANFFRRDSSNSQIAVDILEQTEQQVQSESKPPVKASSLSETITSKIIAPKPVSKSRLFVATVMQNDGLIRVFTRNGLSAKDATAILALKQAKALKKLRTGKKIELTIEDTKAGIKLEKLVYVIDDLNTLTVVAKNNGWRANVKTVKPTVKLSYAAATIYGSAHTAASKKGISHKVMMQLADIFSGKANFNKMYVGDRFSVLYKEFVVNGKKIKDGDIAAAELVHRNKKYRMIGFTDPKGNTSYYTPDGRSAKPSFVRYPIVNYDHIGSRFSRSRFHPILAFRRPHNGVDFAARVGTPIKATSSGRVEFVGAKNGYGKTIIIRLGVYKTLYAHMSRFAKNIRSGGRVKQGQVIGFVGATGLATGPHLHYEFRINGVCHDPLKVKLPKGEKIAPEHREKFFALSRKMLAQLDLHNKDHKIFAMNKSIWPKNKKNKI
jgi:murein DD-endopeptidase MepM/ murein hydrolase activator NlpD